MMKAVPEPKRRFRLNLRSIMSAGEAVGVTVIEWAKAQLGVTINEMFGQTEINYVVGNCQAAWPVKPGSIGRPYPGHRVAIIDDRGLELPRGELGEIAVKKDHDPVFFLEYWKNAKATREKFIGDWAVTGDQGKMDEDGYLWYQGRSDDLIKSAGYRIGPSEIESCLVRHPAVANAAVIGKPDAPRGAIVKARIALVAPYPRQIYSAMLPGVIAGHYAQREAIIDVARLAERAYVEFVRGAVEEFDAARRSVTLRDGKQIGFDLASLNVGSRVDSSVPGSTHHALAVEPFERFIDLLKIPDRAAIAGAGAAGAELAMALRHAGSAGTLYFEPSGFSPALEKPVTSGPPRAR